MKGQQPTSGVSSAQKNAWEVQNTFYFNSANWIMFHQGDRNVLRTPPQVKLYVAQRYTEKTLHNRCRWQSASITSILVFLKIKVNALLIRNRTIFTARPIVPINPTCATPQQVSQVGYRSFNDREVVNVFFSCFLNTTYVLA